MTALPAETGDKMMLDQEITVKSDSKKSVTLQDISKTIAYINHGVELNQPRLLQRAIRQNASIRRNVTATQLNAIVDKFVPEYLNPPCPTRLLMLSMLGKLPIEQVDVVNIVDDNTDDTAMQMDAASSDYPTSPKSPTSAATVTFSQTTTSLITSIIPEVEVYILTLIVTTLLRYSLDADAAFVSTGLIERIQQFNRRSLDILSSKAYFYFSLAYEKLQRLENIRPTLLVLFRTSCVRHDNIGQAVLLNLLLRNYLHYNLIEQAQILSLRTAFPENASNNQFCRYLYYMGRIQAVQLEYVESYQRLMMAVRKAPQGCAVEFTRDAYKLIVIVQLLMGEIPERSTFNQPELRAALKPYLHLTQAVRNGDSEQFAHVMEQYSSIFKADKNYTLIRRLSYNVIKTALRKVSLAYSHITLADVAAKLKLPSTVSATYVCTKAIRDGVIEATINHDSQSLMSIDLADLYATEEPQRAFHKRIAFCLDVHNEAVKSMRYPPDAYKNEVNEKSLASPNEKTIEELIKEMENEMDE